MIRRMMLRLARRFNTTVVLRIGDNAWTFFPEGGSGRETRVPGIGWVIR